MAGMKQGGPKAASKASQAQSLIGAVTSAVKKPPKKGFSSMPSHEAYVVDVPEIADLAAAFQYNYFTPDESVSETSSIPGRFLQRPGESFDTQTFDLIKTRVPRQINITFTPALPVEPRVPSSEQQNAAGGAVGKAGTLIADNLDKIVPEDRFTGQRFVSVAFQDAELDDRLFELVSGSYVQHELEEQGSPDVSRYRAASRLGNALGPAIPKGFLESALGQPSRSGEIKFFGAPLLVDAVRPAVNVSMQLNAKLFHDMVSRGLKDPDGHFAADMHELYHASRRVQQQARLRFNPSVAESDYKSYVPYAEVRYAVPAHMPVPRSAEVVGYVIDRVEMLPDGKRHARDPIVIESPAVGRTVDLRVRYGATYAYTVRTIARFTVPAIDDETGQVALATVLVSSRPSNRVVVKCREDRAPPPPADVGFTWDHDAERMAVHWTFPVNPQRDVKRFQVFRRASLTEPYQLVRMYDFDDSAVPLPQRERPAAHLVERSASPSMRYVDEDFTRMSRFMYALGSVDAHGNVSPYSAQFEVWFDQFRNRLNTRLVSHSGAPRQYPNMYLEADTFVDTIRDAGRSRLRVYFTPECYDLRDAAGRVTPMVATTNDAGAYRLQFINPDAAKMVVAELRVDDRRTKPGPETSASPGG